MKRAKIIRDKPALEPLPQVNRNTVEKFLEIVRGENDAEVALLISQGHDHLAARLASSTTPEGHPAFPYRLEVVAHLAASLLNKSDFKQAAKDAISLLGACKAELTEITSTNAWRELDEWSRREAVPASMNFAEAARYVTKSKNDDVAQPRFRMFLQDYLRIENGLRALSGRHTGSHGEEDGHPQAAQVPKTTDKELTQFIKTQCRDIPGERLRLWRDQFEARRQRELSNIKRVNGKKGGRGNTSAAKKNLFPRELSK